jgi:GntR family transcriptional regulator, transcriptional repressor for pyruvate dehydrogenase complex
MADARVQVPRTAVRLSPMEAPKASDVLANELRERILTGEFVEGVPLPPSGSSCCRPR